MLKIYEGDDKIKVKHMLRDDGSIKALYFDRSTGDEVAEPAGLGSIIVTWDNGPNVKIFDLG